MAFLHYRSGGFFIHRGSQVPGTTPILDVLLGMVAATDEPIAGGRHKVFGSVPMHVPPQTSTIASHLPKAMGTAFAIGRRARLTGIPTEDIAVCTFGDASANHSTACGAFNTAALADHQNLPCPTLYVCEDNGLGISVRTASGWVESRFKAAPGLKYFGCDGLDILETYEVACQAVEFVRSTRRPALLHLSLVRLLGHAGSDVEQLYRSLEEIEETEAQDPVLGTARMLVEQGITTPAAIPAIYEETRARVGALAQEAAKRTRLDTAEEIITPLAPHRPAEVTAEIARSVPKDEREAFFGRLPEDDRPRHMAMQINRALGDLLVKHPEMLVFGEDVARKGGVYHVTADLQKRTGVGRVFNTPLDETSILGLAIGACHQGMLPVPEIQYLAYLHNAIDQLRGEAGSMSFFSNGQFKNPMVVRIAGLAYQKGFGGHFHNDNGIAAIREIPGIVMACPANGEDAVRMLRSCLASAKIDGTVCVFLEPIALYMTKDLHEDKDGEWSFAYPAPGEGVPIGEARTWGKGKDLTIATYGNGLWMSLRVAKRLAKDGIKARVVDLRWLKPLPIDHVAREAGATGRLLIVDECRRGSGIAEALLARVFEQAGPMPFRIVQGIDCYIPLGDAANRLLVQEDDIDAAARALMED